VFSYARQCNPTIAVCLNTHSNVETLIIFRIGYTDAEVMTKEFRITISTISLADLERYEAVA